MTRIIIGDSDAENNRNFKTFFKSRFPDIKIVGVMKEYADHIREIKEYEPNIILADLRFFGKTGYQRIIEINENFPDICIVLYGTYAGAEYMKKTMSYGVVDYMFRPVKTQELENCIIGALRYLNAKKIEKTKDEMFIADYERQTELFRNIFMSNLIYGRVSNHDEIQMGLRYFGIEVKPHYRVAIIRIDHFRKVILALEENEKHMLIYKVQKIAQGWLKDTGVAFINNFNMVALILGDGTITQEAIKLCTSIKNDVIRNIKISVTVGLGKLYERGDEIAYSYNEARGALRYRYYVGYDTVIPIELVEPSSYVEYQYPFEREDILISTAVIGEYDYCISLLGQIIEALRKCKPDEKLLQKIIMRILISINRYATEQELPHVNSFTDYFPSKEVFELKNIEEAYIYMERCLKSFCGEIVRYRDEINISLYNTAKNMAVEKVSENIQLSELAYMLEITPDFLNKLFRKYGNKSFHEFMFEVRESNGKGHL